MGGKVYLVGAGPGDPGLITTKGLACIRRADVIVYDYLASSLLLRHARDDAEMIYVGKKGADHTPSHLDKLMRHLTGRSADLPRPGSGAHSMGAGNRHTVDTRSVVRQNPLPYRADALRSANRCIQWTL